MLHPLFKPVEAAYQLGAQLIEASIGVRAQIIEASIGVRAQIIDSPLHAIDGSIIGHNAE